VSEPLKIAIVGIGRMGAVHALHAHELARETKTCQLVAIADPDTERARRFLGSAGIHIPVFHDADALANSGICLAAVIATATDQHRDHATALISKGFRVLLEKPLTNTLEDDRAFVAELDANYPNSVMLAFQRRFDEPLQYARTLMQNGSVGRVFKIFSALEDSGPAPNGYRSGGILPDMSVHNVDEILWLTGQMPSRALSIGSRIYSHALTTADEDFDDALLCMWFGDDLLGQVQVTRNHVSGYRVETIIFGEEGQIHIGRFDQRLNTVVVEAYGRRGRSQPIAHKEFTMRNYGTGLPEFIDRFGPAYKSEVAAFIQCCRDNAPFPTTHRDGLRARQVIEAGMKANLGPNAAAAI